MRQCRVYQDGGGAALLASLAAILFRSLSFSREAIRHSKKFRRRKANEKEEELHTQR
jgi:hypothetical protein